MSICSSVSLCTLSMRRRDSSTTERMRSLIDLLRTLRLSSSTAARFRFASTALVTLRPSSRTGSITPRLRQSEIVCRCRSALSSSSRTSVMRAISSRSVWRSSPIRWPCSLSRSGPSIRREKIFTSITVPDIPGERRREESFTSLAFSPKIAVSSFSSGESSVSPLGVILPTRMSPLLTWAPMRTMPRSSRLVRFSSATLGISRVISSAPRLVSRTWSSSSWMWIDVKTSSLTSFSLRTMASSKL